MMAERPLSALLQKALRCSFTKRCHSETGERWHAGAATSTPALSSRLVWHHLALLPETKTNQICWFLQTNGENPSRLGRIGGGRCCRGWGRALRTYLGSNWFAPTPHTPMRKQWARAGALLTGIKIHRSNPTSLVAPVSSTSNMQV